MINKKKPYFQRLGMDLKKNYELYLLSSIAIIYFVVFKYAPMYGVQIAFKDYIPRAGISGSEWVGFDNFTRFFEGAKFWTLMENTLKISLYQIVFGFPFPIILALSLNSLKNGKLKRTVQLVTYAPHFISTVAIVGMLTIFLSPSAGIINTIIRFFGGEGANYLADPVWFRTIFVASGIWQQIGWGSIIYFAALSSIDPQLHEAARIDGANKLQRIWHVDIPGIIPTMVIMLIMRVGSVMTVGFEKILLMQNDLNIPVSETISTYVYQMGLIQGDYSFSAAVGLFNSIIDLILLLSVNTIAKKVNETSLW